MQSMPDQPWFVSVAYFFVKGMTILNNFSELIQCWSIKTDSAKGTVILFHGYGGQKSSLLGKSNEFIEQGYNTLLVDFMGSGGSEGNQTTMGYKEAEEVKNVMITW